ncbi:hypothetical protein ACQ4PT_059228 [Festuca glaucescens]
MSTGVRRSGGASGVQNDKRQLQTLDDVLDASWVEEHRRRPEVRIINKYAVLVAFIRIGLKGIGALALLWATVVLLGGFVSDLKEKDFWSLTIIAFIQAAGLSDAIGDGRFAFFGKWIVSLIRKIKSREHTQLPMRQWLKRQIHLLGLKMIHITMFVIFSPAAYFAVVGPAICVVLSAFRIAKQDYGIAEGGSEKANLKPALNLFYYISLAHGATYVLFMKLESAADEELVDIVSRHHGLSPEVLDEYLQETKQMCVNNPASTTGWNLITYGAGLLDSPLPDDYASGGRVLVMLIDQDIPVPITRLLIRSPRQRIQKLIGTLAWKSPAEREMRWLAARIVEHLAGHLNLAQFQGALECISSLLTTSRYNNDYQEALSLPFKIGHSKPGKRTNFLKDILAGFGAEDEDVNLKVRKDLTVIILGICLEWICKKFCAPANGSTLKDSKQRENSKQTDEELVLPGLRILENLAHDRHNCTSIYNKKDLLSKIVAPISSKKLLEDIKTNASWTKVVDGALKLVGRLMSSSGSTGEKMCRLVANDINTVNNLEAILDMDMKSNSSIIELQMRTIELLTQLALHHPANSVKGRRESLVKRVLHIFITEDWMEDYLKVEKTKIDKLITSRQNTSSRQSIRTRLDNLVKKVNGARKKEKMGQRAEEVHAQKKMEEAKERARRLQGKAGEALAMLSSDSEVIKSLTGREDVHRRLTELLDKRNQLYARYLKNCSLPKQK